MSDSFKFISGANYEPFTKQEEVEIFKKYNNSSGKKSVALKNTILERNIRLVIKIVRDEFLRITSSTSMAKNSFDESDLISEGCLGLNTSIDKFDPSFGTKFSTYASFWIRQQILRFVANNSRTVRLPVNFSENMIKVKNFINDYKLKHGKVPTQKRILSEFQGVSKTALTNILNSNGTVYINQAFQNNDSESDGEIGDTIVDEKCPAPSDIVGDKFEVNDIKFFLNKLTEKEKDIITKRFGFNGNAPMKLEEIGSEYNLTRERIRQIQTVALRKLGTMIKKSKDTMI